MEQSQTDRYISFCDIDCDKNADKLIEILDKHIECGNGHEKWQHYFSSKRSEQQRMSHDNLHFIGNQINTLYSYLKDCNDEAALALLYQLEQECC
ncbi:N(2)-fixation sustaining protein CowN [Vibrio hannami]|uniref:N(2)-fixation sustaining protein CowN n=1 Tax=Vibrio hannami TaxID=2717094 RepID=UPI003BB09833